MAFDFVFLLLCIYQLYRDWGKYDKFISYGLDIILIVLFSVLLGVDVCTGRVWW